MGHHADTICHHSLSVLYFPSSHVDHDCCCQSWNEIRRKRSNGLVCPVCCLCIRTSVIMSKSHSGYRSVGVWVARTKAHTPLEVGNRCIRPAVPDPQVTSGVICWPIIWIGSDSPIHHIDTDFVVHFANDERKSQDAQGKTIICVQLLNTLSEAQKLRSVFRVVSGPFVNSSPHKTHGSSAIRR